MYQGKNDPPTPISWASWKFKKYYLPAEFYGEDANHPDSLASTIKWIKSRPWIEPRTNKLCSETFMEKILLAAGLAIRAYEFYDALDLVDRPEDCPSYINMTEEGYLSLLEMTYFLCNCIELCVLQFFCNPLTHFQ